MKCALGILLLSIFRASSINYYVVFSLPTHKICALSVYLARFCAIDDGKLR